MHNGLVSMFERLYDSMAHGLEICTSRSDQRYHLNEFSFHVTALVIRLHFQSTLRIERVVSSSRRNTQTLAIPLLHRSQKEAIQRRPFLIRETAPYLLDPTEKLDLRYLNCCASSPITLASSPSHLFSNVYTRQTQSTHTRLSVRIGSPSNSTLPLSSLRTHDIERLREVRLHAPIP